MRAGAAMVWVLIGSLSGAVAGAADPGSSSPQFFWAMGDYAAFIADDGVNGLSVFRSDGTAGGTHRLEYPCTAPCEPQPFAALGSGFLFLDADALWITHGTSASTRKLVTPFNFTLFGDNIGSQEITAQGLVYFVATNGNAATSPYDLWRSDGTPAGTFALGNFSTSGYGPTELFTIAGEAYFGGDDGSGPALWKTDGTVAGTRVVARFPPPPNVIGPGPYPLGVAGKELILESYTAAHGMELWRSNGTAAGTRALPELVPGPGSPGLYDSFALGTRMLFAVDDGHSENIWQTDGASLERLTNFKSRSVFPLDYVFLPVSFGRIAFFAADDGVHGSELWSTDGTAAGTHMVKDICPGACSSFPYGYSTFAGQLLFAADDGVHGTELWATDGTAGGTRMIADVCPGSCGSVPYQQAVAGPRALFLAQNASSAYQLWSTNGTAAGTIRLTRFDDPGFNLVGDDAEVNGVLLFAGADPTHGIEPWVSDGTRAGTHLLLDLNTTESPDGAAAPRPQAAAGKRRLVPFHAVGGLEMRAVGSSAAADAERK
jgi:ELWxxDGT repeat protein